MIVKGYVSEAGKGFIVIVVEHGTEDYPELGADVEVHVIDQPVTTEESFLEGFAEGRE